MFLCMMSISTTARNTSLQKIQASMYAPPPPPPTINVVQGVPYQPLPPAYPPIKPQGYNSAPPDPHNATLLATPELLTCGHCASVVVPVRYKGSGLCTWLTCGALCGLGFWPCAPFVFCCSCTKDDIFQCPRCRCELGRDRFPRCLN